MQRNPSNGTRDVGTEFQVPLMQSADLCAGESGAVGRPRSFWTSTLGAAVSGAESGDKASVFKSTAQIVNSGAI